MHSGQLRHGSPIPPDLDQSAARRELQKKNRGTSALPVTRAASHPHLDLRQSASSATEQRHERIDVEVIDQSVAIQIRVQNLAIGIGRFVERGIS